ncbi:hypothetical protein COOONC_06897 [Cooperia oncophora]
MMSVFSTAIIPLAAQLGLPFLLVFRFIQGLGYAADFAAIGILCVRWAPLSQTSLFISILTCFTPVSTVITNPLSGWASFKFQSDSEFFLGFQLFEDEFFCLISSNFRESKL